MKASKSVKIPILAAIFMLGSLGIACTSPKAQALRYEFAIESELMNRDNADAQRRNQLHFINQNAQIEMQRLAGVLERQNHLARGNSQRVAQNYIDYFQAMDKLRSSVATEHERVASLHQEQLALGRGYRILSNLADEELRISREVSSSAFREAIRAADEVWQQYKAANPPKLPPPDQPEPVIPIFETHY